MQLDRSKLIDAVYLGKAVVVKKRNVVLNLNSSTLVPHPKTYELIDYAQTILDSNPWIKSVGDIGTGSGLIAINLARRNKSIQFYAGDKCLSALHTARRNAKQNQVSNIRFFQNTDGKWLSEFNNQRIDFIISNPPFIGTKEYGSRYFRKHYPEVLHEPIEAVCTPNDALGISPVIEIVGNSTKNQTRILLFQCNPSTIQRLRKEITKRFSVDAKILNDISGAERFLLVQRITSQEAE